MVVCVLDWSEIMRGARRKMAAVRCALWDNDIPQVEWTPLSSLLAGVGSSTPLNDTPLTKRYAILSSSQLCGLGYVFISWSGNLPPDESALFPSQDFCLYSPHEMSVARKRKAPPLGSPEAPNLELFKMVTKPPKKCDRRGCERFSAYPFCFVQATDRWICETVNLNVVQSTVWCIVTHGPVPVFLTRFQSKS